jgi:hypothetical protein
MVDSAAQWRIKGCGGNLECGPLEATARCGPDGTCFLPLKWHSQPIDSIDVLASAGPDQQSGLQVADLYVRGADLVADFAAAGAHRIAPQIYWRAAAEPNAGAVRIALVLSVRTDLLDSAPAWSVASFVTDSALLHTSRLEDASFDDISGKCCTFRSTDSLVHLFVFRHSRFRLSYVEMVHPADFVEATSSGQQPICVKSKLFPERLEKGVIRRGRICGWFLPAENDLATAVELARRFVDEPLPLTA